MSASAPAAPSRPSCLITLPNVAPPGTCAALRELKWFSILPRQTHTLLLAFVTFLLGLSLPAYLISLATPGLCLCLPLGLSFLLFPTIPTFFEPLFMFHVSSIQFKTLNSSLVALSLLPPSLHITLLILILFCFYPL